MRKIKKLSSVILTVILLLSLCMPAFAAPEGVAVKRMLDMVNDAREAEGLQPLKWDADLAEAAKIRAVESAIKYSTAHKRPNGQSFFSVSTKVWAENSSWGQSNAEAAMSGWLASSGHKANILDERMTIFAAAYAKGDNGQTYWVQDFGTGKSNYSWAMKDFGVKTFTLDPFNNSATPLDKTSSASSSLVDKSGAVAASVLSSEIKKTKVSSGFATVRLKNAKSIAADAIGAAAKVDTGKAVRLQFDTMTANGKTVQGRLTLEPAKLSKLKGTLKTGVYTDSKSVAAVKEASEAAYGNTMAYIHTEQLAALPAPVKVTAKLSLTGLDTKKLVFYSYDSKAKTYTAIDKPAYSIDKSGYLSLSTALLGDIIITDKPLAK